MVIVLTRHQPVPRKKLQLEKPENFGIQIPAATGWRTFATGCLRINLNVTHTSTPVHNKLMRTALNLLFGAWALLLPASSLFGFEGRIAVVTTQRGQASSLLYTAGTNELRIEKTGTDWPYPRDLVNLQSGDIILLFPNNRSFVRLKQDSENVSSTPPGVPATPPGVGPTNLPGMPAMPPMPYLPGLRQMPPGMGAGMPGGMLAMPMMPPPMMDKMELTATDDSTNLLGYTCRKYVIKQRGEVMEIWATDKLFPFQAYRQNPPHRFGLRMIEEQWGDLLKARELFPLLAVLRIEVSPGPAGAAPAPAVAERLRFEVRSVTPEKITDDTQFQPPPDYREIRPLPF